MSLFFIFFLLTKGIGRIRQGWLAFASKARKTLGEEDYDANVERNDDLTPSLGGIGTVATGGAKWGNAYRKIETGSWKTRWANDG